ncbi:hypothetical protein ACTFIZ_007777 [Dictyostelium cf. discoideum]
MLALLKLSIRCDDVQIYHTYFSVDNINSSDIAENSFIYFPVNIPNVHWYLVVLIIHSDSTVSILRLDTQQIEPMFIKVLENRLKEINIIVKDETEYIISQPNQNELHRGRIKRYMYSK